jgi:glycosyltransferase involved in cell wall biosynthesis
VIPWPNMSGGVRVVAIYAKHLQQRGHRVVVLSSLLREKVPVRRRIKSILTGHGWSPIRSEPSYLHGSGVEHHLLTPLRQPGDSDFPDADVVVASFWNTAYHVKELPPTKGAKAIFIQNYDEEPGKSNPLVAPTWRMPMHKIVISKWLVELARERFGDENVSHVPNSVDQNQFYAPPRGKQVVPTVGFLYSKSRFKGCSTSIAAVRRLMTVLPALRVVCFGAEEPGLGLRLPTCAEFHHQPAQDKIKDIYAQCDVWMCGSNREGFHLPPLEAMACRCPVVSTRVGGPLDTIDEGVNGHLIDVGDEAALADRVLRVLRLSEREWTNMSQAAYQTAIRYTWDDATRLFEKALEVAIERGRRGES